MRLADRAAQLYAPAVHALGLATFVGWLLAGHGWEPALTAAIAVLIITCPCALALAVPAVQVVATSRLFRLGVILKKPDGLERLSGIDTIVLDKTGTLTRGEPRVVSDVTLDDLAVAAALAVKTRHPYSLAIVSAAQERGLTVSAATEVIEVPGAGVSGRINGELVRLGSAQHCGFDGADDAQAVHVRRADGRCLSIHLSDTLRPDAAEMVATLQRAGYRLEILSGDRSTAVNDVAQTVGIKNARGGATPADKIARIKALQGDMKGARNLDGTTC